MKKQPPTESAETENALAGVAVDKALIKQFARRIYDDFKKWLKEDAARCDALLKLFFADVRAEISELESLAPPTDGSPT